MKIALEKVEPAQIEKRSFEIIGEELGERSFPKLHELVSVGKYQFKIARADH